jgi:hypothetical protein
MAGMAHDDATRDAGAPGADADGTLAARAADAPAAPSGAAGDALKDVQAEADRLIKALQAGLGPDEATYAVAVLANRVAAELHRLAKAEAAARKGTPEWGTWAALQNSARKLVLDSSTARDGAARLVGRAR